MKLRRLRRLRAWQTALRLRGDAWEAGYAHARTQPGYWPPEEADDFDDYDPDGLACTRCGGEGFREVEDPLWDDCDEFGYGPCTSCRGTGQRKHQWVF